MKFNSDEIASVLQQEIEQFDSKIDVREVGTVLEVGDGIARVYGLSGVMAGEMVEFPNGAIGLAFNLEENSVGIIILGNYLTIEEGDEVKALGTLLSVPAGDAVDRSCARSARQSAGRQRPGANRRDASGRDHRHGRGRASAGDPAAANRYQSDRRDDADRTRSTRVDHR